MTATSRNARRVMIGTVSSAKTAKTITVEVQRTFKHAKYGKYMRRRKRYLAHDEKGEARVGDTVEVASTRPISKKKRWRLLRVLSHSALGDMTSHEDAAEVMADITGKADAKEAGQ